MTKKDFIKKFPDVKVQQFETDTILSKQEIMDKKPRNFATYKEFGKMLREVANIYSKLGDTPLEEEGWEKEKISNAIYFITNKHDFSDFILPWKDSFLLHPFDVTEATKWAEYVKECEQKGIPCNYQEYENQKEY